MIQPPIEEPFVAPLARAFDNTVATYKFYWLMGIMDLYVKGGQTRIKIWDIKTEMIVNAWYPVCYFHLSFGKSENLSAAILSLQSDYNAELPINIHLDDLRQWLRAHSNDKEVLRRFHFLHMNVPFRFLQPWIQTSDDNEMAARSRMRENGCMYSIFGKTTDMEIELNPLWLSYLKRNYGVLHDFILWNLTLFVQRRNPNVPNIPNKLVKPETRSSLVTQHKFWNMLMDKGLEIRCIYTDNLLVKGAYDLDHFMPWSFVSHDLIWNLLPADPSINSSKSDNLPSLEHYLPLLAKKQQEAVSLWMQVNPKQKLLEDYFTLGFSPQELVDMDEEHLIDCFLRTYSPMHQIALNMGFQPWNY